MRNKIIKLKDKNFSINYLLKVLVPLLAYSGLAGIAVGLVVTLFKRGAEFLSQYALIAYIFVKENPVWIPVFLVALIVLALLMSILLKKVPEARGSGIPRTLGILKGKLHFKWFKMFIGSLIGSYISFLSGLSLGVEGPSVQLGSSAATGISDITNSRYAWRRYISTSGACAGFAVAFQAPIAGIIFGLEEVHKKFSPLLIISGATSVMFASLVSEAVASLWGGTSSLLSMATNLLSIPFNLSWALAIVGLACGLFATLFNFLLLKADKIKFKKLPQWSRIVIVFLVSGVIGLLFIDSVGSGRTIITSVLEMNMVWQTILILLFAKFVLLIMNFHSGATGGLFIPMLSLGALVGALCAELLTHMGVDPMYYQTIVVMSMAAFMGASIRAPLTAMVLIIEITGTVPGLLSLSVEIFVAYIIAEFCMRRPFYDVLLEREIDKQTNGNIDKSSSTILTVAKGAFVEDKALRDIFWPSDAKVRSIIRQDEEAEINGRTVLLAGDTVRINFKSYDIDKTEKELRELICG